MRFLPAFLSVVMLPSVALARDLRTEQETVFLPTWRTSQRAAATAVGQLKGFDFPFAEGRLELAVDAPLEATAHDAAIAGLDALAKPGRAARVLGRGMNVARVGSSRTSTRVQLDDAAGTLARSGASISLFTNGGGGASISFHAPRGPRTANGVTVGMRNDFDLKGVRLVERDDHMELDVDDQTLDFLASGSHLNPLRELPTIYKDLFPRTGRKLTPADRAAWRATLTRLLTPRAVVETDRVRYEVTRDEKPRYGQRGPARVAEITVLHDRVRDATKLSAPAREQRRFRIEDDGRTPTTPPPGILAVNVPTYRDALKLRPKMKVPPGQLDQPLPERVLDREFLYGADSFRSAPRPMMSAGMLTHPAFVRFTEDGAPTATGTHAETVAFHAWVDALGAAIPSLRAGDAARPAGPAVKLGRALYPRGPAQWRGFGGQVVPRVKEPKAKTAAMSRAGSARSGR